MTNEHIKHVDFMDDEWSIDMLKQIATDQGQCESTRKAAAQAIIKRGFSDLVGNEEREDSC